MKKFLVALAAMAFVIVMVSGAWANTSKNVTVSASVTAKCNEITANDLTLTIDPATATDVTSSGSATTVQCTYNKPFNVTAFSAGAGGTADTDGSLAGVLKDGSKTIPYTLTYTNSFTGGGFGTATATTLVTGVAAKVVQTEANKAEEGTYSDTVTITILY